MDPGDPERVFCAFNDWREKGSFRYPEVYFSASHDGGKTWSSNVRVNDVTTYYQQVASRTIGVDEYGTIYVEWLNSDFAVPTEARISCSHDEGNSFSPSVRVNERIYGIGTYPSLAVHAEGGIASTWMDYRNENWDIFFSFSEDGGKTWCEPNVRVDDESSGRAAYCPVVSLTPSGDACVAWQDYRAVTCYDIYFSRGEYPWNAEIVLDGREEM
jgi:hypothetical protein